METITIQVPPEIAQAYSSVSSEERKRVQTLLQIMDEISQEAAANGMTPEILESILTDES
jgi:hypothetical protein